MSWKIAKVLVGVVCWVIGLGCVVTACGGVMTCNPLMTSAGSLGALSCWQTFLSTLN